jgi:MtrB/PioB family decaheme-associated outer membrane protein
MTAPHRFERLRLSALALALLAAFGTAAAQTTQTEASVTAGLALISGDSAERAWFGQYNGLRDEGNSLFLLGVDYWSRDEAAGTQIDFVGINLFGESREAALRWKKQGEWKLGLQYDQLVRYDPLTVHTGLQGAGSPTPQVVVLPAGDEGSDYELKTRRTSLGLGFWKAITPDLVFEMSLRGEEKTGSRLFGSGITCPSTVTPGCSGSNGAYTGWAQLVLPEPIDSNHSQVDLRLNYAVGGLRLNAGYYGSFYDNANSQLAPSVPGSLNNALGTLLPLNTGLQALLNLPLALPPDNQAHQLDVTGSYAFTGTTQLRFKLAYARAQQDEDFVAAGWSAQDLPADRSHLGGRLDTTLAQLGLSSRPTPQLSLNADLRYEDKDDKTPVALYNVEGTSRYTNAQFPDDRSWAKLLGTYQFSGGYRGLLAVGRENIDRGVFTASSAVAGVTALRQKTGETGYRAELQRLMAENFSGAVSLESSQRDGSNWLKPNSGTGVTEVADPADPSNGFSSGIFMPSLANRERDKLKLRADWQPSEALALQFVLEDGRDRYEVPSSYGLQKSDTSLFSLDMNYALSPRWTLNGYAAFGRQTLHQSRPEGYILSFENRTTTLGLGFSGKPADAIELGGGLNFIDDKNAYTQALDGSAPADSVALLAATGGLPDITFRQTELRLFGRYDIDKRSSMRVDFVYHDTRTSDWTWGYGGTTFAYSDGSTVSTLAKQQVAMVSVTYSYRWP